MLGGLFVILAGTFWALDTIIRYPLLGSVSAERIVFTEHLYLFLIFLPYYIKNVKNFLSYKVSALLYFSFIGVLGSGVATLTFTKAFTLINPSLVILLQKFQPIISILLASVFLGEKIKKEFIFWGGLALLGSILISSPDIFPNLSSFDFRMVLNENSLRGYLFTFIAVISWAASTVFGKKLGMAGLRELDIMGGRFFFGFLFMSLYLISNPSLSTFDYNYMIWGKILLMVVLAGILGMYFYYKGLKLISAKLCALLEMFFPLAAVTINWIYLGKALTPIQIIGASFLILGSLVIQLKRL